MSDLKKSDQFNRLDNSKKRLYSQMSYLNTNYYSSDFSNYLMNSKASNDFKIQKNELNLPNDKIINEMNTNEKNTLNEWDAGRKPLNYSQYYNNN